MKISQVIIKFNEKRYSTDFKASKLGEYRINKILNLVGTGKRVLDVGCYDGTIANKVIKQGNQIVGLDIADSAVKLAKKNGVEAYQCNVEENGVPTKLGKFDVVIAGEIIEHVFDTDNFIKSLGKALKKNGHLIITTPNLAGLGSRISLLLGKKPWMIENSLEDGFSGHIRYFTYDELRKVLERNNFKVIELLTDSVGIGDTLSFYGIDTVFPQLGRILIVKAEKI